MNVRTTNLVESWQRYCRDRTLHAYRGLFAEALYEDNGKWRYGEHSLSKVFVVPMRQ